MYRSVAGASPAPPPAPQVEYVYNKNPMYCERQQCYHLPDESSRLVATPLNSDEDSYNVIMTTRGGDKFPGDMKYQGTLYSNSPSEPMGLVVLNCENNSNTGSCVQGECKALSQMACSLYRNSYKCQPTENNLLFRGQRQWPPKPQDLSQVVAGFIKC